MLPVASRSIPSQSVSIPFNVKYPVPNHWKKEYNHSKGTVSAAILLITKNKPINTGICINILKHHFNGPAHSFLRSFIVSSESFLGSSLYFSWISCIFGCSPPIDCCILAPAKLGLIRSSLTTIVIHTIAHPKLPPNKPRNNTMILNTGRYNTSEIISINGFINITYPDKSY